MFRNIKDKLGKLLVGGEADGDPGIQFLQESHSGSDHIFIVLGAVQNPVHEKALVLVITVQNLKRHRQHRAVRVGLGAFDLHGFQLHFIIVSGDGGEITAPCFMASSTSA